MSNANPSTHSSSSTPNILDSLPIGRVKKNGTRMKPDETSQLRQRNNRQRNNRQRISRPGKPDDSEEKKDDEKPEDVDKVTTQSSNGGGESVSTVTVAPSVVDKGEMGGRDDDHDHNNHDEDFACQPTSSQHSTYIRENLELLQKKCLEFQECTKEVYSAENFHRILSGGNIQLSNICGLMYPEDWEGYANLNEHCRGTEREAIREDINSQLAANLANPPQGDGNGDNNRRQWRELKSCIDMNRKSGEKPIKTACRLKKESSQYLCDSGKVDQMAEEFFNHEMEHLHCSCKAISEEAATAASSGNPVPVAARIGIAIGGLSLLVILVIVVIILCLRHRKVKRELDKHRMQYLPSSQGLEAATIYQEIGDHGQAMEALRRAKDQGTLPSHYNFLGKAPELPERYVKDISRSRNNVANTNEGDPEYLEPTPRSGKRSEAHINDAYNSSQGSSQRSQGSAGGGSVYALAKPPSKSMERLNQAQNETYFSPINMNEVSTVNDRSNYSQLSQKYAVVKKGEETGDVEEKEPLTKQPSDAEDGDVGGSTSAEEEPKYFVLESQKDAGSAESEAFMAPSATIPV